MPTLSPNKIYTDFKNNKLDKKQALSLLISIIDDIYEYDDNIRLLGIKFLELFNTKDEKIFNFLENLLISDLNEHIRGQAARTLIFNFPEKALKPVKWALKHDNADSCLIQIIKSIEKSPNKNLKSVIEKIQYVNFKGNIIFPSRFYPLINLNNQNIDNIKEIKNIESLTNINKLYLNYNQIKELNSLNKLRELRSLHLQGNMIRNVKGLSDLKNLESLYLNNNEISTMEGINGLTKIKLLMLYDNNISNIRELETLSNLEVLNLRNNKIAEIKGLRKLSNLRRLDLSNNQISEIKGLDNLKKLEFLDLSHNIITEVKGLETLLKLKFLDLRNNNITRINGLDKLTNLQFLYLGFNQVLEIEEIERFKHVKVLDIKNVERIFIQKSLKDAYPQKIGETDNLNKKSIEIRDIKFIPILFGTQSIFKQLSQVKDHIEYFTDSSWMIILKNNEYQTFKLRCSGRINWLQRRKHQVMKIQ